MVTPGLLHSLKMKKVKTMKFVITGRPLQQLNTFKEVSGFKCQRYLNGSNTRVNGNTYMFIVLE